jgi:hypothetical protein
MKELSDEYNDSLDMKNSFYIGIIFSCFFSIFNSCTFSSHPSDADQITIKSASPRTAAAVLNGKEEVVFQTITAQYKKFSSELQIYSQSANGCYLLLNARISLKADSSMHQGSPGSSYFWDSRIASHTSWKLGNEEDLILELTKVDTAIKIISGTFTYKVNIGGTDYRLSQGSFTDVPFIVKPDSDYNYSYTIEGQTWIDTNSATLPISNYLIHPKNTIHLEFNEFSRNDSAFGDVNLYLDLPINKITIGDHDLLSSAYSISCSISSSASTGNQRNTTYEADSLQSGTLTILAFDPMRRSISGNFHFNTKDNAGNSPVTIVGSFNNIYWDDQISN